MLDNVYFCTKLMAKVTIGNGFGKKLAEKVLFPWLVGIKLLILPWNLP